MNTPAPKDQVKLHKMADDIIKAINRVRSSPHLVSSDQQFRVVILDILNDNK